MRKGIMALEGLEQVFAEDAAREAEAAEAERVQAEAERAQAEAVQAEVDQTTSFVAAPEAAELPMGDAAEQVEAIDGNIDEAVETSEVLCEIEDHIERSVDEGGLSEPAAAALDIVVEHYKARLSFPAGAKSAFPALEGFKAPGLNRRKASQLALENLRDTVGQIVVAVREALKRALAWLGEYLQHLFDATARYQKQAEALAEAGKGLQGAAGDAAATVSTSGFGKALLADGRLLTGSAFVNKFAEHVKKISFIHAKQIEAAQGGQKALVAGLSAKTEEEAKALVEALGKTIGQAAMGEPTGNKDRQQEGFIVREESLVFGGKSFYSTVSESNDFGRSGFNWTVGDGQGERHTEVAEQVRPLSAKEAMAVAKLASEHLARYRELTAAFNSVKEANSKFARWADEQMRQQGNGAMERIGVQILSAATRNYVKFMTKGSMQLRSYDLTVVKSALQFATVSLKALQGAPGAAPALAAPAAA